MRGHEGAKSLPLGGRQTFGQASGVTFKVTGTRSVVPGALPVTYKMFFHVPHLGTPQLELSSAKSKPLAVARKKDTLPVHRSGVC